MLFIITRLQNVRPCHPPSLSPSCVLWLIWIKTEMGVSFRMVLVPQQRHQETPYALSPSRLSKGFGQTTHILTNWPKGETDSKQLRPGWSSASKQLRDCVSLMQGVSLSLC